MVWELIGYSTDMGSGEDVRWREYTTSAKKAAQFRKIRKIQFFDSGHGIVFNVREHRGRRKPDIRAVNDHVTGELRRIQKEEKLPLYVQDLLEAARELVSPRSVEAHIGQVSFNKHYVVVRGQQFEDLKKTVEAAG